MKLLLGVTGLVSLLLLNTACTPVGVATSAATTTGVAVVQERSVGNAVDDSAIRIELNHLFLQKDINDLFRNVTINVIEGRVMLTGNVDKPETALEAVRLAWLPRGVKEVINELEVNDKSSITNYTTDAWVAGQIRARLLLDGAIRSVNYNIESVNQKVYIFGIARTPAEMERVTYIASTTKYVKEVISHIVLANDPRRFVAPTPGKGTGNYKTPAASW